MSRIVLMNVRLAFPQLREPKKFPTGTDPTRYFSASFLMPPDHAQLATIRKAIEEVVAKKWPGQDTTAIIKAAGLAGKLCLKNGDGKPDTEGFPGNYFVSARTKEIAGRPKLYGLGGVTAGELAMDSGKPYGGCYVNAIINLFAYGGTPGIPKGVGAGLGDIQFVRDGDAFAGGAKGASEGEFGDISAPLGSDQPPLAATGTGGANAWD
jgi:hypothetical protein